jgi:hypothetical protein
VAFKVGYSGISLRRTVFAGSNSVLFLYFISFYFSPGAFFTLARKDKPNMIFSSKAGTWEPRGDSKSFEVPVGVNNYNFNETGF